MYNIYKITCLYIYILFIYFSGNPWVLHTRYRIVGSSQFYMNLRTLITKGNFEKDPKPRSYVRGLHKPAYSGCQYCYNFTCALILLRTEASRFPENGISRAYGFMDAFCHSAVSCEHFLSSVPFRCLSTYYVTANKYLLKD